MAFNITFTELAEEFKSVGFGLGDRIIIGFVLGAAILKFKWPLF
jgi:hypothetical protein